MNLYIIYYDIYKNKFLKMEQNQNILSEVLNGNLPFEFSLSCACFCNSGCNHDVYLYIPETSLLKNKFAIDISKSTKYRFFYFQHVNKNDILRLHQLKCIHPSDHFLKGSSNQSYIDYHNSIKHIIFNDCDLSALCNKLKDYSSLIALYNEYLYDKAPMVYENFKNKKFHCPEQELKLNKLCPVNMQLKDKNQNNLFQWIAHYCNTSSYVDFMHKRSMYTPDNLFFLKNYFNHPVNKLINKKTQQILILDSQLFRLFKMYIPDWESLYDYTYVTDLYTAGSSYVTNDGKAHYTDKIEKDEINLLADSVINLKKFMTFDFKKFKDEYGENATAQDLFHKAFNI
jgi:hypothetical protein